MNSEDYKNAPQREKSVEKGEERNATGKPKCRSGKEKEKREKCTVASGKCSAAIDACHRNSFMTEKERKNKCLHHIRGKYKFLSDTTFLLPTTSNLKVEQLYRRTAMIATAPTSLGLRFRNLPPCSSKLVLCLCST